MPGHQLSPLTITQKLPGGIIILPKTSHSAKKPPTIKNIVGHRFSLPTTEFDFQLVADDFVHDIIRCLPVARLLRIRQLQKLTWLRVRESPYEHFSGPHTFGHNRLVHSLWSAAARAAANAILGITGPDALVGVLVEVIHDLFTSAGGDIMKVINPTLFDEDNLIAELFRDPKHRTGWKHLQTTYNLPSNTPEIVCEALQGRGVHGELHEVFDTWSYLANDLNGILIAFEQFNQPVPSEFGETIRNLGHRALSVWRHVSIENGRAYVTNPEILAEFLLLRTELWRQLYCHPGNKTVELLYRRVLLPYFFRKRKLAERQLLLWHDETLAKSMDRTLGFGLNSVNVGEIWPQIEYFSNWDTACAKEDRAAHKGDLTVLASTQGDQPVKPKTGKYLVRMPQGELKPFNQAYPELAHPIEHLAATPACERIQLITYPRANTVFPEPVLASWQSARKGWKNEPEFGRCP